MRTFAITLSCLFSTIICAADNWPQFRGPTGDGHAGEANLPLQWSESDNVKWKVPVHDKGWSSPVVWSDQIWLTTATEEGHKLFAVCFDRKNGKVIHDLLLFEIAEPKNTRRFNSFASPTPVIEEGRIYVHFGSYGCACIDTKTGKTIWSKQDVECDHWRGPGSSPIIDGDIMFTAYDGHDHQFVVGRNKNTGEIVWKKDRTIDYRTDNGDLKKAFSTCIVIDFDGRRQLIAPSAVATIAYDPATGDELWTLRHGGMNVACKPLFGNGLVYIAPGSTKTLLAVRPDGNGDVTESHLAWQVRKSAPKRPSPLLIGELLYMISDDGVASCLEAKTGEVVWQKRVGGGEFRASPILADGRIYFFNLDGDSPVIQGGSEFKLLAENKLDNGFYASPAVVGNSLILRSTEHLYCIE